MGTPTRHSLLLILVVSLSTTLAAVAQRVEVPADAMIRLERTSCAGTCPIYSVTIDAVGTVTYDGKQWVRAVGRQTARIDPSIVATLLTSAERIRFFDMRAVYDSIQYPDGSTSHGTDFPGRIVTITANGRTKRIDDYVGAPDVLAEFEREIDEAAGTKRWIFLDEETLAALRRSGWSASTEEGARLLQEAIRRDEITITRTLIDMGADLHGPAETRLSPLGLARSSAMVDLLVKAGADPNERPVGRVAARTPLMGTGYQDASVTEALLKVGARLEDVDDGRTALYYAACAAGNWRVVTVLLEAGANPRGSENGLSALACTRQKRQVELTNRRPPSAGPTVEDFDRVIELLENAERRLNR
jgi:hypothetical protein